MGNIVLLDDLTINKIAAGEVIERPASVVKEMVENSIDAGAKHITIEIKNGGISFIKITDDGKGIQRDDVELAFERHATSKIRTSEDLNSIKSMGFRGEALASIASIANVELVSKTEECKIGTKIVVEGGDILSIEEIGCTKGTSITVKNLFYNTPVRYKFLKKDFTESGYIEDIVTRLALVHPEIAIKFINTGKVIMSSNGSGNLQDVIYSIFGKEVASNTIDVNYEYDYISIKGAIGKPIIARSNRSNQIFFVNDRYIRDKNLSSAVEQAFKGMLPIGKFAFLVLNVEMPQEKVDVNVHPAKLEVRFSDENLVFKAMFHAIKDTLLKNGFITDRENTLLAKEASKNAFKINNIEDKIKNTYTIKQLNVNENENNIIESIYNSRQNEKNEDGFIDGANILTNQDIFDKLKSLQEELKNEVKQNPNLHLTETYKEMEEKYNAIISSMNKKEETENKEKIINESEINNTEQNEEKIKQEESIDGKIIESQEITEKIEDNNINTQDLKENIENNNEITHNVEKNEVEFKENTIEGKDEKELGEKKQEKVISFKEMYKQLFGKEPYGGRIVEENKKQDDSFYSIDSNIEDSNLSMFEGEEEYKKINYKFIGIAFNTYIILEINDEIYIMDQHAAHERIMYEKVKKNFFETQEKSSQMMLLPDIITLTHKEMDIAKDNFELFKKAGFIIDEFGENTIKISGVPDFCMDLDTENLFKETLDEINVIARTAKQEKEEKFLATIACKAAVKANMSLTKEEVDSLMQELLKLPNPFTCPHGRPTIIKLSKYEIERKFARK